MWQHLFSTNEWMFLRHSFMWQENRSLQGFSIQNLSIHAECWVSRTKCYKGLHLWSCNQLLVIQFCTSYWYIKIRKHFCTWFMLWGKVRTNCIIRRITAKKLLNFCLINHIFWKLFLAWNIVLHNFPQFWTVFPSFGREKLGKTGLSQFIPFWTVKTSFGREKPNPA